MKEKKELIQEEYDKFETIYKNLENQLKELVLTDIIASLMTEEEKVVKDENGEDKTIKVKNYDKFNEIEERIKAFLNEVKGVPKFDLEYSIQSTLDSIKRIKNESLLSMRSLHWVNNDVLKEEEKDA